MAHLDSDIMARAVIYEKANFGSPFLFGTKKRFLLNNINSGFLRCLISISGFLIDNKQFFCPPLRRAKFSKKEVINELK